VAGKRIGDRAALALGPRPPRRVKQLLHLLVIEAAPHLARRVPRDYRVRPDVACDHAAGPHDGAVADRDTGEDERALADPHVVADADRPLRALPAVPGK